MKKNNNLNRRVFIQGTVAGRLGLTLGFISCTKSTDKTEPPKPEPPAPDDNNDDESLKITDLLIPASINVSKGMSLTLAGKGFAMGDKIMFHPTTGGTQGRISVDVSSVAASSVVVILPDDIASTRYDIYVGREDKTFRLGTSTFNLVFNADIPDKEGMTVKGTVYAAGAGLADVVVSDGFAITKTDANGVYYLPSAKKN